LVVSCHFLVLFFINLSSEEECSSLTFVTIMIEKFALQLVQRKEFNYVYVNKCN
jgi:hypothetical protein